MNFAPRFILRLIFLFAMMHSGLMAAPLERSVSTSRQFLIYGASAPLRGAISELAEKTKNDCLRLLQRRDQWKVPIVVNLQFRQANLPEMPPVARYFSQTGSGLKFQLDFTIGADVDAVAIQRELLRAILLEMSYRAQPDLVAGTVYVEPPDWLVEGMLAAAFGQDRAEFVEALAPLLSSHNIIRLEEFLRQKPALLDSPGQLLYRAYSFALLQLLISEAGGVSHLSAYIDSLSRATNDPLSDLKKQFPVLAGAADIDEVWKVSVTKVGVARNFELLTVIETQRRLEEMLARGIPDAPGSGKTLPLENLVQRKISAAQTGELNSLSQDLILLAASANPVVRPVVVQYQEICQLLAAGKRKALAARLARLRVTRQKIAKRMSELDDYMNWFEATKSNSSSGAFTRYLRAAEKSKELEPRRHDALSVYLDALEAQFPN